MTGGPSNYWGQGFSLRGDKGRFVLPTDFRGTVLAASGNAPTLCLDKHFEFRCLVGFGLSRADSFEDQVAHEERVALERKLPFNVDTRLGQLCGFLRTKFDESGRFIMPDHLAEQAGISNSLYFHGGGKGGFTIWEPEELFAMDSGWDGAKATCRALMSQGRGRGK